MKRWKSASERERILEQDCEKFVSLLRLVSSTEEGRHVRWLLKGDWTWAEVVTLGNGIYVGGDIETVVFQGGGDRAARPRGRVYWMATRSYGYAREKANIGGTGRDEWDEDCARGDILWHRRLDQLTKDQARELWDLLERGDVGNHELAAATYRITHDAELCDLGIVVNKSVYMATAVLRRLAHLFDCEGFRASSHEWLRRVA